MNTGTRLYNFFTKLSVSDAIPGKIEVLNPYINNEVLDINRKFFDEYYSDNNSRILLLGINPGRFGAGVTGLAFTDPVVLANSLGIDNSFQKKAELSATFIHDAINEFGGYKDFFNKFLLSAISPLGFIKDGININYYDDKELLKATLPFIKQTLEMQYVITGKLKVCGCIGQGTNYKFLKELNAELNFFKQIIPLPHPRWVMQYRRKELGRQLSNYVDKFNSLITVNDM